LIGQSYKSVPYLIQRQKKELNLHTTRCIHNCRQGMFSNVIAFGYLVGNQTRKSYELRQMCIHPSLATIKKISDMRKLIITLLIISGFMIVDINGQSIDKSTTILGDWYACGLKIIQVNDTATFYRSDSVCTDKDCLYFKWGLKKMGK